MITILSIISVFFVLRLATLFFSIKNEKRLRKEGAVEYGKINSLSMTIYHVFFYVLSISELIIVKTNFDVVSFIGVCLFVFSYIVLLYVMYQIRDVWTVKLFIAKNHKVNTSFLFKYVRHPNYYLNIIPELIGIGMLCHAWYTMAVILPFYALTMYNRITVEEKVMKQEIPQNS